MAVSAGERLRILAADWNDLLAMLRWWKQRRGSPDRTATHNQFGAPFVWIKNTTQSNLNAFEVLQLSDLAINVLTNPEAKYERLQVDGITPVAATAPYGRYAVLNDPAPAGGFARAVISGDTLVKLNIVHAADWACDIANGVTSYLQTSAIGTSRILLKHTGTGASNKYGVVRLGDGVTVAVGKASGGIALDATDGIVDVWDDAFAGDTGANITGCRNETIEIASGDKVAVTLVGNTRYVAPLRCAS